MKKALFLIVGLLTLCAFVGSANALQFTSIYDPIDTPIGPSIFNSVSWTADLAAQGYDHNTMVLQNATLTLNLIDDNDVQGEAGALKVQIGQFWILPLFHETDIPNPTTTFIHNFTSDELAWLQGGITDLWVYSERGDFIFQSASLVANSVPEPATMLLLGLGLVGLAGFGRKKFNS